LQGHFKPRFFSGIVHRDSEGAEDVRRSLPDWRKSMDLVLAGPPAEGDRYIGYREPYARGDAACEEGEGFHDEVRKVTHTLYEVTRAKRDGKHGAAESALTPAREK